METEPNGNKKEEYEKLLKVETRDTSLEELKQPGIFRFVITPEFNIFLSKQVHEIMSDYYKVSLDETLAEGTIEVEDNGEITVSFKHRFYHPMLGFKGSDEELSLLQQAARIKILDFMKQ